MHIAIDGFNIAMPRGTGVATSGRMLAQTLAGGHRVDGVFGLPIDPAAPKQLCEVEFLDGQGRKEGVRTRTGSVAARWIDELAYRIRPIVAGSLPNIGQIDARVFQHRLPDVQRILNATNLFGAAHRHFHAMGRFLRVRVPAPVLQIMHWTYPMSLTMLGARNIFTLHDLVPLRLPYTTMDNKPFYLRLLVDAYNPAAIGAAMERMATDDALSARLAASGPARTTRFDAAAYRSRLAQIYLSTIAAPRHSL